MAVDIPNYRVVEKLGEGAQSRLFRARSMQNGKDYTVKIIKIAKPEDTTLLDLLKVEHTIGTAVDHPVIRKVYELRVLRQRFRVRGAILFMEYVPGIAMSEKDFRRSLRDVVKLFTEVSEGLHAMHHQGFVHADLKPNNIIVTPDDLVKVIDLGQSARIREAKTRVQGTIDYMAPEQVARGILDERTDVFGLGAALHRIVTGKAVATDMNQQVTVHSQSLIGKRLTDGKDQQDETLPTAMIKFLEDCCQHDPADRISNMGVVTERLKMIETILESHANHDDDDFRTPLADEEVSEENKPRPDPLLEELGLVGPDDSIDLDGIIIDEE
ncbi:MAG: serine/threonine protein kinase [Phycisphaerae bacterium]